MPNIFLDNIYQQNLIKKTKAQFHEFWEEVQLSGSFLDQLHEKEVSGSDLVLNIKELDASPIGIYLTSFLININYVTELIDEELTEELFEFWEKSEFTSLFFSEHKKQNEDILKASVNSLQKLEEHFLSYYSVLFSPENQKEYFIKPIPEIGDYEDWIYIEPNKGLCLNTENTEQTPDGFVLTKAELTDSHPQETINQGKASFILRPGSKLKEETFKSCRDKISRALGVLCNSSSSLLETFSNFTHTIVALNEPGMVSFSLQSLPGYSSINLFERDFVDCIDDLIHENGHHYLNTILNHSELIIEDPEKDYFSPWRMNYRPIRGIYHGTFTFYWALKLFSDLCHNENETISFTDDERDKIRFRYVEEYHKIMYCKGPIEKAYQKELITDEGLDLINKVFELTEEEKEKVGLVQEKLIQENQTRMESILSSLES